MIHEWKVENVPPNSRVKWENCIWLATTRLFFKSLNYRSKCRHLLRMQNIYFYLKKLLNSIELSMWSNLINWFCFHSIEQKMGPIFMGLSNYFFCLIGPLFLWKSPLFIEIGPLIIYFFTFEAHIFKKKLRINIIIF